VHATRLMSPGGASDFEAASDAWANDFNSETTYSDGAEPFYDLDR